MLVLFLLAVCATPATAGRAAAAGGCVSAGDATYRHSFDGGAGTATVTAVRPLCSGQAQGFSLLSYTSGLPYPQFIYDEAQATIDAGHGSVRLAVTVPTCYFEVGLIFGSAVVTEVVNADSDYGNLRLGAPSGPGSRSTGPYGGDAGGTAPCVPKPVVTFQNACDGSFTATLADDPGANVDAVFLVAGRRVRVAPGHVLETQRHSGSLTIRDNTYTTTIGTWQNPPTGCDSASPSTPVTPPPAPGPPSASAPPNLPSTEPSTTDWTDPADAASPSDTVTSSAPAHALPTSDRNSWSTPVIAAGVLMMVAGLAVLVRMIRTFPRE